MEDEQTLSIQLQKKIKEQQVLYLAKWLNRHSKINITINMSSIFTPTNRLLLQIIVQLIIFQTYMLEKDQTMQSILELFQKCCT